MENADSVDTDYFHYDSWDAFSPKINPPEVKRWDLYGVIMSYKIVIKYLHGKTIDGYYYQYNGLDQLIENMKNADLRDALNDFTTLLYKHDLIFLEKPAKTMSGKPMISNGYSVSTGSY